MTNWTDREIGRLLRALRAARAEIARLEGEVQKANDMTAVRFRAAQDRNLREHLGDPRLRVHIPTEDPT